MLTVEEIEKIVQRYGSPLYIFYSDKFKENYMTLEDELKKFYPKYIPAYSYKTNYTPVLCKIVKELGGYAEVVSDMEYQAAKALGYESRKIIYNGPYKGERIKEQLLEGGILNIDNLQEVLRVCSFSSMYPDKQFCVGLRLNIDIGQSFLSRFGIDADSDDLAAAVKALKEAGNIRLEGFHCHIGRSRTVESWRQRTEKMLRISDQYFCNRPPIYLDLGSGMFGNMNSDLAIQFGDNIPSYRDYAEVTAAIFAKHFDSLPDQEKPILFTEPGTTVISSYMDFVGQVDNIKQIKGKTFITMNCSKDNIGDICKIKRLPLHVIGRGKKKVENADIVGYTCLEHDVMYEGFTGEVEVGNYILFENVGGYSNVAKPPFILPNCPMVQIDGAGTTRLIKRRETFDDVFSTYMYE